MIAEFEIDPAEFDRSDFSDNAYVLPDLRKISDGYHAKVVREPITRAVFSEGYLYITLKDRRVIAYNDTDVEILP